MRKINNNMVSRFCKNSFKILNKIKKIKKIHIEIFSNSKINYLEIIIKNKQKQIILIKN